MKTRTIKDAIKVARNWLNREGHVTTWRLRHVMPSGATWLGNGSFGGVIRYKGLAIKSSQGERMWEYLRAIITGELGGPHVPKVYYLAGNSESWVAVMELCKERGHDCAADAAMRRLSDRWPVEAVRNLSHLGAQVPTFLQWLEDMRARRWSPSDLYGSNVLVRKDGTFVITDPMGG